ncbi:uncharacterized protein LOC112590602 [Harpegnathos saltator]|uniref:uncharacterized protein LOC112590602 n=1 Tax=Harpegnathos saltator TaxID=610380 RepID=UPI000DBED3D2|nr:uncharacterized protein LOC112590602 [Harpegnathos saltator]
MVYMLILKYTFNFPLQTVEDLDEVEQYLQEPNHFQSTVKQLSKMGGTTPYDFVKRCLSLLLSNKFSEQYSWYGAKKKQVFGKLFLARLLQESALQCEAAKNRKEVEEGIKTWLRRAKERAEKEQR